MFICLDQERIFYSNKKLQKLLKLNPKFQEFRKNLGSLYNEFNKNGPFMTGKNLLLKNNERQNNKQNDPIKKFPSKNLIYNPNKEEEANCKKIFEIFRKTLEGISSNIIPKTPIFINNETKVIL